jgi:uncharacterized protein
MNIERASSIAWLTRYRLQQRCDTLYGLPMRARKRRFLRCSLAPPAPASRRAYTGLGDAIWKVRAFPSATSMACTRLRRAAIQGHVEAQWQLAMLHLQGVSTSVERAETSEATVGLFLGNEVREPGFVAAEKWARRAAEAGSGDAQAILAYILSSGPEPMRDLEAAHRWYERSAESMLGDLTRCGMGVERRDVIAADLYRQSAEKGNRLGQARWGLALVEGIGVERNRTEGELWLRRAAIAGDPEAAARIGDLYARRDDMLPPNHAEAAIWYRRVAEAGHRTAARSLGLLYLVGAGVARDPQEAAHWLHIAVDAGDPQARGHLANLSLWGYRPFRKPDEGAQMTGAGSRLQRPCRGFQLRRLSGGMDRDGT